MYYKQIIDRIDYFFYIPLFILDHKIVRNFRIENLFENCTQFSMNGS